MGVALFPPYHRVSGHCRPSQTGIWRAPAPLAVAAILFAPLKAKARVKGPGVDVRAVSHAGAANSDACCNDPGHRSTGGYRALNASHADWSSTTLLHIESRGTA